jgi:hypothetical protein
VQLIVISSALAAIVLTAGLASANRMTAINFTNNLNPGAGEGQFPPEHDHDVR